MSEIKIFLHDPEAVREAVLSGKEMEETSTQYGANEFALDFLRQSGIWEHLLVKPCRGKENGKDWRKLSGIAILLELLHMGHLAKADKVIKDAKLMRELGFTFSELEKMEIKGRGVIHRDTLRNYFKAIPADQSLKSFYGFINFLRKKRWNRGKIYAADGYEIEVYGKTYEGSGKVYDEREGRWKYGYKLVILMNLEEERERILGFALGPINMDERKLLLKIFEDLERQVGKVRELIEVIVLDRGFWGYDFLEKELVEKYQIDYVLLAKKSFTFVKEDLRHLIDSQQLNFQERKLFNRTSGKWEEVKVAFAQDLYHGYVSKAQPYLGKVNAVVLKKKDNNGEEKEIIYVTNKKVSKNPLKIAKWYGSRWTIENQGFRELSQKWLIDIPAGRTLNAISARISLILKLYNAIKIMEMKHGKEWQKNKEKIEAWGERSLIGGQGLIIYTEKYFATFTPKEFKRLIEERTKRLTKQEDKEKFMEELEKLKGYLPRCKIEELHQKLFR